MKFILNKRIKYYTKETLKWINLVAIALFIIFCIVFLKYNLVCEVSIAGENIGYVENKNTFENKIQELLNKEGTGNIAFVDLDVAPEYKLTFLNKTEQIDDTKVLAKIEENITITYEYYAVNLNDEQKAIVATLDEAEKLVSEIKEEYENSVDFKIGITPLYSENGEEYEPVEIEVAENKVSKELDKIEDKSVNGIYLAQKPITGVITSRFGSRESIRSYPHNGLDIAAPYGTNIKSATKGTVSFAGYNGSYGNLIIVDCGNGVQIYYGHCSKLLASVGDKVEAGDIIAQVGSTGNSTGNHLHFEIKVNGVSVNPQNYIYN